MRDFGAPFPPLQLIITHIFFRYFLYR